MSREKFREVGSRISIPCEATKGAFLNEYLISVETANGPISGFIKAEDVIGEPPGKTFVVGIVRGESDDRTIIVRLPGSFFKTTGIAYFSHQQMAEYAE